VLTKSAMSERPGTTHPGASATCVHERAQPGKEMPEKGLESLRLPPSNSTQPQPSSARTRPMPHGVTILSAHFISGRTSTKWMGM